MLRRLQESCDFLFEDGELGCSDMLRLYSAVAIDQECDRQPEDSAIELSGFRGAHYDGIVHVKLLVESAGRVGTVVHGDADNLQSLVAILLLQFGEMRSLDAAGLAPASPKIEKNQFAAIGRQPQIRPIQLRQGEIRRKSGLPFCGARRVNRICGAPNTAPPQCQ